MDLHWLFKREAIEIVRFLVVKREKGQKTGGGGVKSLVIVTGTGTHSVESQSVLRPALLQFLETLRPDYVETIRCEGSFIEVFLCPR